MTTRSTENLRTISLEVIDNYRKTAKFAKRALLASSHRGIRKVDSTVNQYEGKLGSSVRDTLDFSQEKILAATDKADEALSKLGDTVKNTMATTQDTIVSVADKADSVVDKALGIAAKRVAKFPPKNGFVANLLEKAPMTKSIEDLGIPGAKFVLYLSGKLADGTEKVAATISGEKKKTVASVKKAAVKKPTLKKTLAKKVAVKKTVAKPVARKQVKSPVKAIVAAA